MQLLHIFLKRLEGPNALQMTGQQVSGFEAADKLLSKWSDSVREGSYDKCRYTLVFDDGFEFAGRYDLQHWREGFPDLHDCALRAVCFALDRQVPASQQLTVIRNLLNPIENTPSIAGE